MLLGEYSVRTGKTPQQHKSTYTMTHDIATGEVNPAQQAAIRSRSHWSGAGQTRLTGWRFKANGGEWSGRGNVWMSVGWGRKQERLTALLSRGRFQQQPCQGHCVGEPEKDTIVLSLGRVNAFQFCRLLSLSILVSNIINFSLKKPWAYPW